MTGATLLLRQIYPSFAQAGRVTSQAFRPTPKDKSLVSVYDGDQITADAAWVHYSSHLLLSSVGVMAVTVDESAAETPSSRGSHTEFLTHSLITIRD